MLFHPTYDYQHSRCRSLEALRLQQLGKPPQCFQALGCRTNEWTSRHRSVIWKCQCRTKRTSHRSVTRLWNVSAICNRKVALATERFAGTHSCATSGTLWPLPSNNQSEPLALNLSPYPCCGIVLSSKFIQHTSKTSPFHQNETNILHFPAVLLAYMKNKSYFCRKK